MPTFGQVKKSDVIQPRIVSSELPTVTIRPVESEETARWLAALKGYDEAHQAWINHRTDETWAARCAAWLVAEEACNAYLT